MHSPLTPGTGCRLLLRFFGTCRRQCAPGAVVQEKESTPSSGFVSSSRPAELNGRDQQSACVSTCACGRARRVALQHAKKKNTTWAATARQTIFLARVSEYAPRRSGHGSPSGCSKRLVGGMCPPGLTQPLEQKKIRAMVETCWPRQVPRQ